MLTWPMCAVLGADQRVVVLLAGEDAPDAALEWQQRGYVVVAVED
ncbi:MAG: hypothetical protein QOG64_150 [Acidimicrobiaceae bacterium]|nr:hypothetical protein [Acidimicrobiaceae bacterium]